jgi:adenylate kinase
MLGPPGSGKGTQAEIIAEKAGVPAISTGDMLRQAVAEGSELGLRVKSILDSGALVDDDTMADVIAQRLSAADAENGFLLDGYPRTNGQAETLDGILDKRQERLGVVLLIEVPEDELVRRSLARQRADDTEEVIRNRQRVYREQTAPLIDRFTNQGILVAIDGNQTIEQVQSDIQSRLEGLGAVAS